MLLLEAGFEFLSNNFTGVSREIPRVNDLNVQADASGDEDEIEWEEG